MDNELTHWGIKGQKWGRRRFQNKDGSLTPAGRERYADDDDDSEAAKNRKEQVLKSGSAQEVLRYQGRLTNKELQDAVQRIQWENQLNNLSQQNVKTGWDKVKEISDKVGTVTNVVNNGLNAWNTFGKVYNSLSPNKKLPILDGGENASKLARIAREKTLDRMSDDDIQKNLKSLSSEDLKFLAGRSENTSKIKKNLGFDDSEDAARAREKELDSMSDEYIKKNFDSFSTKDLKTLNDRFTVRSTAKKNYGLDEKTDNKSDKKTDNNKSSSKSADKEDVSVSKSSQDKNDDSTPRLSEKSLDSYRNSTNDDYSSKRHSSYGISDSKNYDSTEKSSGSKADTTNSSSLMSKIKSMSSSGKNSASEIAAKLGVSTATVNKYGDGFTDNLKKNGSSSSGPENHKSSWDTLTTARKPLWESQSKLSKSTSGTPSSSSNNSDRMTTVNEPLWKKRKKYW